MMYHFINSRLTSSSQKPLFLDPSWGHEWAAHWLPETRRAGSTVGSPIPTLRPCLPPPPSSCLVRMMRLELELAEERWLC